MESRTRGRVGRTAAALMFAVAASGCENPMWRFDRYVVTGEMTGKACRVHVTGAGLPRSGIDSVEVTQVSTDLGGIAPVGFTPSIASCGGLTLMFVTPLGTRLASGTFKITSAERPVEGIAVASYFGPIPRGVWLPAVFGVYLAARSGEVTIENFSADSVRATFTFHAVRRMRGE